MNPYVGEIRTFPFNVIPRGWAACNGQILAIQTNTALFSLLGTYYGGNGVSTFALPNFQGTTLMHSNAGAGPGIVGGVENVTLITSNLPQHNHIMKAVNALGNQLLNNGDDYLAQPAIHAVGSEPLYAANGYIPNLTSPVTLTPNSIASTGTTGPHENRMPFLTLSVCIALNGVYPSRN